MFPIFNKDGLGNASQHTMEQNPRIAAQRFAMWTRQTLEPWMRHHVPATLTQSRKLDGATVLMFR